MTPYYSDSLVTIYHGDCRDLLPELTADVLVTDPPYGSGFASGRPTYRARQAGRLPESWDTQPFPDLDLLLTAAPWQVIWGGNHYVLPPSRGWLVWVKPDAPPSMGSVELAWTNLDRTPRHIVHSIRKTTANGEREGHLTQKPLAVMLWTLSGMPDGSVLDPFAGTGSTIVAAKNLGRRAIGIEVDERWCEVAATRCAQEVLGLAV